MPTVFRFKNINNLTLRSGISKRRGFFYAVNMNEGFILLHRKIKENWLWQRSDYFHWFTHLLLKANFKDNDSFLFEGEFISIKRGQFITSYRNLAKELPVCSEQKIRTFLKLLIKDKIVLIDSLRKATRITICNYDSYQSAQHNSNTVATQQQHSSNTVATTIERKKKKENNENNDNNNTEQVPKFNFKKELLNLGVEKQIVEDWLKVRKIKKAANTETALNSIIAQIQKSGLTANECIKKSVESSWSGFKADWLKPKTLNGQKHHEENKPKYKLL